MLYVERDSNGAIVAIRHSPGNNATEKKEIIDDEIIEFFKKQTKDPFGQLLSASDAGIIRIVEDLIDVLVRKNIILFTELPLEAQKKIEERQMLRVKREDQGYVIDSDDII